MRARAAVVRDRVGGREERRRAKAKGREAEGGERSSTAAQVNPEGGRQVEAGGRRQVEVPMGGKGRAGGAEMEGEEGGAGEVEGTELEGEGGRWHGLRTFGCRPGFRKRERRNAGDKRWR